jgi:hypothetical protein
MIRRLSETLGEEGASGEGRAREDHDGGLRKEGLMNKGSIMEEAASTMSESGSSVMCILR